MLSESLHGKDRKKTHKEECYVPTEVVIGETLPQARGQQEAPEAQEARGDPSLEPSEETWPDPLTLDFWPFRPGREYISMVFSHPVCGH